MARTPQWNVKGVDDAARLVAREAADKAGLPLGVWIDRAVLRAAAKDSDIVIAPHSIAAPVIERTPEIPPMVPPPEMTKAAPRLGPAPERPTIEELPSAIRSTPRFGRGARIALAVGVAVVLIAGGGALLMRKTATTPTASTTETPPQLAALPPPTAPQPAEPPASAEEPQSVPQPPGGEVSPVEALHRAAESGDMRAQYDLGVRYAAGRELPKDDAEAARWFERAAIQGFPSAQYNLGVYYDHGIGVPQDDALAFSWYSKAAEQGHPRAEHNLATAYANGKGTAQDMKQAAYWYEKASDAGLPESQFYLGLIYERGLSGERDPARAWTLYRQAAAQGHPDALERLKVLPDLPAASVAPAAGDRRAAASAAPRGDGSLPRSSIAEIQRLLARLDFDPGPADGVMGRKTVQAIASYQGIAGIAVDGKPSASLLEELREVAGAAKR
jgi:hypothetical protein